MSPKLIFIRASLHLCEVWRARAGHLGPFQLQPFLNMEDREHEEPRLLLLEWGRKMKQGVGWANRRDRSALFPSIPDL